VIAAGQRQKIAVISTRYGIDLEAQLPIGGCGEVPGSVNVVAAGPRSSLLMNIPMSPRFTA
jgi:hypothetical protein